MIYDYFDNLNKTIASFIPIIKISELLTYRKLCCRTLTVFLIFAFWSLVH